MSLADELLADLEEDGDEVQGEEEQEAIDDITEASDVAMETEKQNSIHGIAKLRDSDEVF
jgi:hypothetical protein